MPIEWSTFGVDLHLAPLPPTGRRAALEQGLRDGIRTGRLAAPTRLPSSRALAPGLAASRGTVTAAYDQLIAEGYLLARRGSGTVIAELPADADAASDRPAGPAAGPGGAPEAGPWRFDLRPGTPDPSSFPSAQWLRAVRRVLARPPASVHGYGDPRGRVELRTALAGYLGRVRGVVADPDRIVITSGAVQGLSLLATVLARTSGGSIAMEDPGLAFHRQVVRQAGAQVVPIEVDDAGARTDRLAQSDVRAVVLTPAHQYPTGVSLHPARRTAATEWARSRDGLVIEDDYDGEFRYDRLPIGALQGRAPERVAYLGSASKSLGPA